MPFKKRSGKNIQIFAVHSPFYQSFYNFAPKLGIVECKTFAESGKIEGKTEFGKKIYILDANVFLRGAQALFLGRACATVFGVVEEMKSAPAEIEMERFIRSGLAVLEPSKESVAEAENAQKATLDKVSRTDIFLAALALDFKKKNKCAVLVTDDYGVQNLCLKLELRYSGAMSEGIKKPLAWSGKCTACGFRTNGKICPECGSKVRFKARQLRQL